MKFISLLSCLIFIASCALNQKTDTAVDAAPVSVNAKIEKLVNHDKNLTEEQKKKTRSILYRGLSRAKELRLQERALASAVLRMSLVENAPFEKISKRKKEMKKIYSAKYDNFDSTITELKEVLGIRAANNRLINSDVVERLFRQGTRN